MNYNMALNKFMLNMCWWELFGMSPGIDMFPATLRNMGGEENYWLLLLLSWNIIITNYKKRWYNKSFTDNLNQRSYNLCSREHSLFM